MERESHPPASSAEGASYVLPVHTHALGVVVADPQGRLLEANRRFLEMLGYTRDELPGRLSWMDLTPPEGQSPDGAAPVETTLTGDDSPIEKQYLRKDGTRVDVLVSGETCGQDGTCVCYIQDIGRRKATERALSGSQARLSSMVGQAGVGIGELDLNGTILTVNRKFCDMLGYTAEEMLGHSILAFSHPDDVEEGAAKKRQLIEQELGSISWEKRYLRKDGSIQWTQVTLSTIRDETGQLLCYMGVVVDISARKAAEERLDFILRANQDGMWDWNLQTGEVYWSERLYNILGYSAKELVPDVEWCLSLIHPDDSDRVMALLRSYPYDKESYELEFRIRHFSGEYRTVLARGTAVSDEQGRIVRLAGTLMDTTEQTSALQGLLQSLSQYRQLSDANLIGVLFWNTDGYITDANEAFCGMVGYSRDEMQAGQVLWTLLTPPEYVAMDEAAVDKLKKTGVVMPYEKQYIRKDGSRVDILCGFAMMAGSRKNGIGFIYDITERKRMEQSLRFSESRFRRVVESGIMGFVFWEKSSGEITDANDAFLNMVGYTREELLSGEINWRAMTPPEYHPLDDAAFEEMNRHGKCEPYEKQYIRKDGSRVDILLSVAYYEGRQDSGVAYILDITDLRRTKNALAESEARFRNMAENAPVIIWMSNAENRNEYVNRAFLDLFGLSEEQALGNQWLRVVHPEDREKCLRLFHETAERRGCLHAEVRVINRVGETRWLLVAGVPRLTAAGEYQGYIGCCTDITEQKTAQKRVSAAEESWRHLANAMPAMVWTTQPHTGDLTYISDRWTEYTGLSREESLGMGWLKAVHPEDLERARETMGRAFAHDDSYELECRYRRYDGMYKWFIARANPIYDRQGRIITWYGTSTDIHDLKEAQHAIRESEDRFRQMADTAPVLIWASGLDKLWSYFNKPWLEFTGRTLEEEIGNGWTEGVHPDDLGRCLDVYVPAFDARQQFRMEFRLRRHDGEYRWLLGHGVPRLTPDGEFLGYIGSCIDIHDRKQMEFQLEEAKKAAETTNRQKSEFLAMMSHELRTPLNSIIGYSRMIENGMAGSITTEQSRYIHNVSLSGGHLLNLVNDLLDLSKAEAGKMHILADRFELAPVIYQLQTMMRELAEQKQVRLSFDIEPGLDSIEADPARFRQILINLISNAVKFNKPGGSVQVRMNTIRNGRWLVCRVEDTGIGIPEEQLTQVFSRFFQVDASASRSHEGTGLGLALTKELIHIHGGDITVESRVGVGSVFTFKMPTSSGILRESAAR